MLSGSPVLEVNSMPSLEQVIGELRVLFEHELEERSKREKVYRGNYNPGFQDELVEQINGQVKQWETRIASKLETLLRYPPQYIDHMDKLKGFHEKATYDRSVFIMTKFPKPDSIAPQDLQLSRVITATKAAVTGCGYTPRMASDYDYKDIIWKNVEFYLLGCGRGIAIVEDRYKDEFNPNVAMEWGWMRAMSKPVLYLVEEEFGNERADAAGFTGYRFLWDNPEEGIPKAVEHFLIAK
jgi:hypothetical protein